MKKLTAYFEEQAFGVCSSIGTRLGISAHFIRLYFIYASFFTLGSPVLIYLALAAIKNLKKILRGGGKAISEI